VEIQSPQLLNPQSQPIANNGGIHQKRLGDYGTYAGRQRVGIHGRKKFLENDEQLHTSELPKQITPRGENEG